MEFLSPEFLGDMLGALTEGADGAALWHELDIQPGDEQVIKRRFSALIQGSSDLGERLQAAGIDTVIITGTATNVCCEFHRARCIHAELPHASRLRCQRHSVGRSA